MDEDKEPPPYHGLVSPVFEIHPALPGTDLGEEVAVLIGIAAQGVS